MRASARSSILLAALLALGLLASPASAGTEKVNAWMRSGGRTVGRHVVDPTGEKQILKRRVDAGSTVWFAITVKHRGSSNGSVEVRGCAGSPDFAISYLLPDGTNISMDVVGTGYTFRHVGDGDTVKLTMKWRVRRSARGSTGTCGVLASTRDRRDLLTPQVHAA
jgi:hypothetical protein